MRERVVQPKRKGIMTLEDAKNKVTPEMVESLKNGEELQLNANYVLYKYIEHDIVTIIHEEEWEEKLQVMHNGDNLLFEVL